MQTIQCVKKVCETVCRQVPCTVTVCDPVTVVRKVQECRMVCEPKTVVRQIPVEVCVRVPVASAQSVMATPQSVVATPQTAAPIALETADRRQPVLGRLLR